MTGQQKILVSGIGIVTLSLVGFSLWREPEPEIRVAQLAGEDLVQTGIPETTPITSVSPKSKPSSSLSPSPSVNIPTQTALMTATPTPSPSQPVATPSSTLLPSPSPTPVPSQNKEEPLIVINEIGWMGTEADPSDEWIELFNPTSYSIHLAGWTLRSMTGAAPDPVITLDKTISAFGFLLLERSNDSTISDTAADMIYTGALNNNGERLELRNAEGALVDVVDALDGWYAGTNTPKHSMERINPKEPGDEVQNWASYNNSRQSGTDQKGNPIQGTPGSVNSVALPP